MSDEKQEETLAVPEESDEQVGGDQSQDQPQQEGEESAAAGETAATPAAEVGGDADSAAAPTPAPAQPGGQVDATEETGEDQDPPPAEAEEEASAATPAAAAEDGEGEGQGDQATEGGQPTEAVAAAGQEETPSQQTAEKSGEEEKPAAEEGQETAEKEAQEGQDADAEKGGETEGEQQQEGGEKTEKPPADGGEGGGEAQSPLPQSDTFGEGERAETPTVAVGEPLSREGSPRGEDSSPRDDQPPSPKQLEAGTPERVASPLIEEAEQEAAEEEEYEEEEEEVVYNREELLEQLQSSLAEKDQLLAQNLQLQHKLADYFRKKKTDEQRQEVEKNASDQEQRYTKYMANLEELGNQEDDERDNFKIQIEELKEKRQMKQEMVDFELRQFNDFKKQIAVTAINSRTGKPIVDKDVEQHLLNEKRKEQEVVQVRLENIKLKNKLKKREQQLKAKEELAEGLHLIDFEQLKIENQTYNEKIEERNEELLKLRKKITSTVQVLTHLKEKLQFVQAENLIQKGKLKEVEIHVSQKRDVLSRTKKARDMLRIDNQRLRQKCGLLGNEPLLRDFEERKDESEDLRRKLDNLRQQHAELILACKGYRKKIDQARAGRS